MQRIVIVFLAGMLVGCIGSPDNLEGKNFDADSIYCRQLRQDSNSIFRFDNDIAANRARGTNPQALSHEPATPIQLSNFKKEYERNCESRGAYLARKNRE